jgi:membrane protease YdiL (CAAX protease family)
MSQGEGERQRAGGRGSQRNDLVVFLLVAFGLSWLFALPLWLAGGAIDSSATVVTGVAMMTTPTLGVLAVWRLHHRDIRLRDWARQTGITLGERRSRTYALIAAAWLGVPLLAVLAVVVSAVVGVLSVDLGGFGLFRQMLEQTAIEIPLDPATVAVIQFGFSVLIAPAINAIPALGEEWGWRGWLLPHLSRLGTWPALLLSGTIWGAWHAPLTLRGYNYAELGAWAAPMFVVFCVIFGTLLGWLRLTTGSVWPAVIGHAALNASAGVTFLVGDAANPPNLAIAGITGVVGWVLLAAAAVAVVKLRPIPARSAEALQLQDGVDR